VVNSYLVCDPTIRQPGFDHPRQQWSLVNCFRTEQRHCSACRRKRWLTDTDLCPCGKTKMMSHIVESCPLTKLNGSLSRLHFADEDAVSWLTNYGSWHACKKKNTPTLPPVCQAVVSLAQQHSSCSLTLHILANLWGRVGALMCCCPTNVSAVETFRTVVTGCFISHSPRAFHDAEKYRHSVRYKKRWSEQ